MPDRVAETSETVLKGTKTRISAKMGNPASVEFREMKRARGKIRWAGLDSICGYVGGRPRQAKRPETSRFYISSKKTRRILAVTLWLRPRNTISAIEKQN